MERKKHNRRKENYFSLFIIIGVSCGACFRGSMGKVLVDECSPWIGMVPGCKLDSILHPADYFLFLP
jgi:hypothetical protein